MASGTRCCRGKLFSSASLLRIKARKKKENNNTTHNRKDYRKNLENVTIQKCNSSQVSLSKHQKNEQKLCAVAYKHTPVEHMYAVQCRGLLDWLSWLCTVSW